MATPCNEILDNLSSTKGRCLLFNLVALLFHDYPMVYWLKSAQPDDLFVFRVELGPPNYSILDLNSKEISNRWEQAKVMNALAERIWNEAVEETGAGARHVSKISAK